MYNCYLCVRARTFDIVVSISDFVLETAILKADSTFKFVGYLFLLP